MTRARPRGQLHPGVDPDVIMMICTAGHVDHGKTELVKLLTGCNTDRLKEEQERGMTIELGFAPCFLGGNLCVGIVDVPGHEKLVRNMVAGVSGIDLAVLVVAADDGIMPQTVEHVQILQLLGVRRGLVALTKTDLVSPEQVERRVAEIRDFLRGTFMESAGICPVSSRTLSGYDEFYEAVVRETTGAAKEQGMGLFRMPIERSFVRKGFGTVATGLPLAGTIRVGDEVELVPGGKRARVRGIQRFLRNATEGGRGQCLALNVPELGLEDARRGRVFAVPGSLRSAAIFHVRLAAVPGLSAPLKNAEEVHFHAGTAEEHARVYLLEDKVLLPGTSALATIVVDNPVAAVAGDRFIIRRMSPPTTIGGGRILSVSHDEHRPMRKYALELLRGLEDALGGVDISDPSALRLRLAHFLKTGCPKGGRVSELARDFQVPVAVVQEALSILAGEHRLLQLDKDWCIHTEAYAALLKDAETRLRATAKEKASLSADLSVLRGAEEWPEPLWKRLVKDLESDRVMVARGSKAVLADAVDGLSESDRALLDRIADLYEKTGFESPRPDEVPGRLNADPAVVRRLLDYLFASGRLVRLSANVALSYNTFRKAEELVVEIIRKDGVLDSADFKYRIGSSRKYALAILDFLDARRVTLRMENNRKLAPDYEKNML